MEYEKAKRRVESSQHAHSPQHAPPPLLRRLRTSVPSAPLRTGLTTRTPHRRRPIRLPATPPQSYGAAYGQPAPPSFLGTTTHPDQRQYREDEGGGGHCRRAAPIMARVTSRS